MQFRHITEDYAAGGQPTLEELRQLPALGFKSLMINRPDGETLDQPPHAEEMALAAELGLEASIVALVPGQLTPQLIEEFKAEYDRLPKPIFAHCKSGPRSAMLWALGQKDLISADDIVKAAADAGFDVSMLRPLLGE